MSLGSLGRGSMRTFYPSTALQDFARPAIATRLNPPARPAPRTAAQVQQLKTAVARTRYQGQASVGRQAQEIRRLVGVVNTLRAQGVALRKERARLVGVVNQLRAQMSRR